MTKEQIVKMCADWMSGADDEIKMSDWLRACFDEDIDEDVVMKEAEKILKER